MTNMVPFRKGNIKNVGFGDFYNMLDDFFTEDWPLRRSLAGDKFKVDLHEDEHNYFIEADLPGVNRDEINIAIDEGKLKIMVNREEKTEDEQKKFIHRERRFSSMQRNIYLPETDSDNIKAKLENGVLNVTVPKKVKKDTTVQIAIE